MWVKKPCQTGKLHRNQSDVKGGRRANGRRYDSGGRGEVILRKSRKDLLDFYTAESISPKVDEKKEGI